MIEKFGDISALDRGFAEGGTALVLGVESSCDETAAAVVDYNCRSGLIMVRSSAVASQIDLHAAYGGVFPEIASRAHVEAVSQICGEALRSAGVGLDEICAVACTSGPGLVGSLLAGLSFAKGLAYSHNLPLVGVSHLKAHIAANYPAYPYLRPPFLALAVSGGNTLLMDVRDYADYRVIGATRDDAAGEAFDKIGRVLGLPYPAGALIDKLAREGDADAVDFKIALGAVRGSLDFSFSGMKTAVLQFSQRFARDWPGRELPAADICAALTQAVCRTVCAQCRGAIERGVYDKLVCAGGVMANSHLRAALRAMCADMGIELFIAPAEYCGDNGMMTAAQACVELAQSYKSNGTCAAACAGLDINACAANTMPRADVC